MAPYIISIECKYKEFWRYNLIVSGAVMSCGERVGWIGYTDEIAAVGSSLSAPPADYRRAPTAVVKSEEGDALTLYIYIIPHTLPTSRVVSECKPFEISVCISHGEAVVYNRRLEINQWSGDNIEIKIEGDKLLVVDAVK